MKVDNDEEIVVRVLVQSLLVDSCGSDKTGVFLFDRPSRTELIHFIASHSRIVQSAAGEGDHSPSCQAMQRYSQIQKLNVWPSDN